MKEKVFPNVPADSVIVLDRASYHIVLTEKSKPAFSNMKKQQFAEWLVKHKIKVKNQKIVEDFLNFKRTELADLYKKHKP